MRQLNGPLPSFSAIVVSHNDRVNVLSCLSSLLKSNYQNFEVILVDNNSTDGTAEQVLDQFEANRRFTFVPSDRNLGLAGGCNKGARFAHGDFLAFLSSDMVVSSDWLKNLADAAKSRESIAAIDSKIKFAHDHRLLYSLGGSMNPCGVESREGRITKGGKDAGRISEITTVFYAKLVTIRASVFRMVGGFDPLYFLGNETRDLCWRIWLAGYEVVVAPDAVVYHVGSAVVRSMDEGLLIFHARKNMIMTLIKNYELHNVVRYLLLYLSFMGVHWFYVALKGKRGIAKGYLRAVGWIIRNKRYVCMGRIRVQQFRKVKDKIPMSHMAHLTVPFHFQALDLYSPRSLGYE